MAKKHSKAEVAGAKKVAAKAGSAKAEKSAGGERPVKNGRFGVAATFRFIFANLKLFLPLLLVAVVICALTSGMSEDAVVVLMVIAFLML